MKIEKKNTEYTISADEKEFGLLAIAMYSFPFGDATRNQEFIGMNKRVCGMQETFREKIQQINRETYEILFG